MSLFDLVVYIIVWTIASLLIMACYAMFTRYTLHWDDNSTYIADILIYIICLPITILYGICKLLSIKITEK